MSPYPLGYLVSWHCSGLQDRTSLRRARLSRCWAFFPSLFRSPRPDFIETVGGCVGRGRLRWDCSGLQDRTSLRQDFHLLFMIFTPYYCSGLQDRTSLRQPLQYSSSTRSTGLFRSPRPDFIETATAQHSRAEGRHIVPVSKTGLH